MARYQIILAYDGTCFKGYQRQARARTVQGVVEEALRVLQWNGKSIITAGRTDTGVHADGQVVAVDLDWRHSPEELLQALNANLPQDVAVRAVKQAAEDFHPRYDAVARTYRYTVFCDPVRDPLRERFAWRVWPPIQWDLLQPAARVLIGSHDFAAFGTPPRPGGTTVRTVFKAEWRHEEDQMVFEISANAFLYHMVRRLVFLQEQVGQGRLAPDDIRTSLGTGILLTPGLAPSQGLSLWKVTYPSDGQL